MKEDFFTKTHCDRCQASLREKAHIMSKFNQDVLCLDCKEDERKAPGYAAADAAEAAAVRAGNRDFPGVGLTAEDQAFLARRRAERQQGG